MIDAKSLPDPLGSIELFYYAYRAFTARPDRVLAQRGLNRVHHRVLYFVGRTPGMTVSALLDLLKVSKQALNAPLRQLIEMKLVSMETAEHDRRARLLSLTEEGEKLEQQLTATQMRQLAAAFESVGVQSEDGWRAVMQFIASHE